MLNCKSITNGAELAQMQLAFVCSILWLDGMVENTRAFLQLTLNPLSQLDRRLPDTHDFYKKNHLEYNDDLLHRKGIFPIMERAREEEDLPLSQSDMLIFDVYSGHRGQTLKDL